MKAFLRTLGFFMFANAVLINACDFYLEIGSGKRLPTSVYRLIFPSNASETPRNCRVVKAWTTTTATTQPHQTGEKEWVVEASEKFNKTEHLQLSGPPTLGDTQLPAIWLNCSSAGVSVVLKSCKRFLTTISQRDGSGRPFRQGAVIAHRRRLLESRSEPVSSPSSSWWFAGVSLVAALVVLVYLAALCAGKKDKGKDNAVEGEGEGDEQEATNGECVVEGKESGAEEQAETGTSGSGTAVVHREEAFSGDGYVTVPRDLEGRGDKDIDLMIKGDDSDSDAAEDQNTTEKKEEEEEEEEKDSQYETIKHHPSESPAIGRLKSRISSGSHNSDKRSPVPPQKFPANQEAAPPLPKENPKQKIWTHEKRGGATPPPAISIAAAQQSSSTLYAVADIPNQRPLRSRAFTASELRATDATYAEPELPSSKERCKAFTLPAGLSGKDLISDEVDPLYDKPDLGGGAKARATDNADSPKSVLYAQPFPRAKSCSKSPSPGALDAPAEVDLSELYAKVDMEKKRRDSSKEALYAQPHKHRKPSSPDQNATASLGEDGYSHVKPKTKDVHGYSKVGPGRQSHIQRDALGYAKVGEKVKKKDPGYEKVGPNSDVVKTTKMGEERVIPDPGYEKVGPTSTLMTRDTIPDPEYEKVGPQSENVPDPGYARLAAATADKPASPVDPNYEDVGEVRERVTTFVKDKATGQGKEEEKDDKGEEVSMDPNYDEIDEDFRKKIEEFQHKNEN